MKKMKKYIVTISLIFLIGTLICWANPIMVKAATAGDNFLNSISTGGSTLISMGQNAMNSRGIGLPSMDFLVGIAQVLYFIGCVIVIGLTIFKAVKYSMSEASDKASLKKELGGWIIICVIIIAAYPFFKLIASIFDGTLNITNQFANTSQGLTSVSASSKVMLILNTIYRIIQVGAIGYILIRFTIDGIRFFTTSVAKEKAEGKGRLQRDLIWAVVIFGAAGFFEILYQAFN